MILSVTCQINLVVSNKIWGLFCIHLKYLLDTSWDIYSASERHFLNVGSVYFL